MKLNSFQSFLCRLVIITLLPVLIFFSGCSGSHQTGSGTSSPPPPAASAVKGTVRGGEVPVTQATLQLYAVGTTGDGSLATPLLTQSVTSDNSGNFTLTGTYTCPSPSSLVYAAASGGNPGLGPGINNTASILIAVLGPCDNIPASFIINEVTTVAAVWPLAPFMSAANAIGSSAADANALSTAFTLSAQFANVTTGLAPGNNIPDGTIIPVNEINTLANILSACVNSAGGSAGDNTPCGQLFSLTTPPGDAPPTTIVAAGRLMEQNPAQNISQLFALIPANAPFTPALSIPPVDLSLSPTTPSALVVTPSSINFPSTVINFTSSPQTITLHNTGLTAINIGDISLTGANAADFTSSSTCTSVLTSNQTCTIDVDFNPMVAGSKYAYLTIANSAVTVPIAIPLTGIATPGTGALTLSPSSLSFSQLSVPQSITLTNSSPTAIALQSISLSNQDFTQTNTCGSNIATQASCTVSVTATVANTDSATPLAATLSIITSDTTGIHTVPLSTNIATVPGPLVVSPTSLAFTTAGVPQVVTLTNSGTATLTLQSITVADSTFGQTNTCNSTLAPSASCTVSVTANSIGATSLTGALTIQANDAPGTHTVSLATNVAPIPGPLVASPTSLTFTTTDVPQVVTLTNSGTAVLTLQSIAIADSNFTQTNTCNGSLNPGANCTVSVTANSLGTTPLNSSLTIQTNDAAGTHTIPISTSITPVVGPLVASPTSLSFTTADTPQTITLTNSGNAALTLQSITIADSHFGQTNTCNSTLAPSASCTVSVTVNALDVAPLSGALTIQTNDATGTHTIPLSATASSGSSSQIVVSPTSLTFPTTLVNFIPPTQTVTITNNSSESVLLSNLLLGGAQNNYTATQAATCINPLDPGQSCTFQVSFTPTVAGQHNGTLQLASNPGETQATVALIGTAIAGTAENVTLSPSSLSFTQVGIPQSVTVTNSSTTAVAIGPITIFGNNSPVTTSENYSQTNNCGASLAPQSVCTISVSATSLNNINPISGTLTVATGDIAGIHTLPLSTPISSFSAGGAPIAFSPQAIGTTQMITFFWFDQNGGGSDSESIEGPDTDDFSLGPDHSLVTSYSCSERQCLLSIYFTPTTTGLHTTTINTPVGNIVVTGTGIPAGPSFAVTSQVPDQPAGTNGGPSVPNRTVTLLNNGTTSLNLSETITGSNASQFFVTTPCPQNLTMGSTCTFTVNFKPTQYGNIPAVLNITDATSGISQSFPLNGYGQYPPPSVSPNSVDFGPTQYGTTSAPIQMTITAPLNHPVALTLLDSGTTFSISASSCSATPCQIAVTFAPDINGSAYNIVAITDTVTQLETFISLEGVPGVPKLSFSPSALSFPTRDVGTTSIAQTVTLTDIGDSYINQVDESPRGFSVLGDNPNDFVITTNCVDPVASISLQPNDSCTFSISFSPTAAGTRSATLQILSNDPNSPTTLQLTGTATSP